ncbi:MAG: PIN domain-containing protein [Phycisphaeraceae bacterium JB051]
MSVIVDTCVWSSALRRKKSDQNIAAKLTELITHNQVVILGPIRQEILSGIVDPRQFEQLKNHLAAFIDFPISPAHYETAAKFFNICRSKGIQGSHVDFLICAISTMETMELYTTDKDFIHYKKFLDIHLYAD